MNRENKQIQRINIKCGTIEDSFDDLKQQCVNKAEELLKTMDTSTAEHTHVAFWTANIPELICIAKFYKNENGVICYDIDFSQSTL